MSLIVGLTGQTGAGKTTACKVFSNCGFGIINCDLVARDVVNIDNYCLNEIVNEFSEIILNSDKTLNRKTLGKIVFSDKEKLLKLNKIIHPYIIIEIKKTIDELSQKFSVIILDAPTLFESKANKLCDKIVSVIADADIIIPRIIKRDSISKENAENRLNSQHNKEFFIKNSDFVASNNGLEQEFIDKLYDISKKLKEYTNGNSC